MAGLGKAPNLEMRQAILTLAARFAGMAPSDLPELGTSHAINQCALRMSRRGELHMGDNAGNGRRRVRYFTDKDHRDFWVKQQTQEAHPMPITPPAGPAAWAPPAAATKPAPPQPSVTTSSRSHKTSSRSHKTKRLRGDATVQGLDTAPHHCVASRLAEHLMRGDTLRVRAPTDLPFVPRPGSMDFRQHPTRISNELRYLDGRVEQMQHARTTATA
jgi:hypothetical protein